MTRQGPRRTTIYWQCMGRLASGGFRIRYWTKSDNALFLKASFLEEAHLRELIAEETGRIRFDLVEVKDD